MSRGQRGGSSSHEAEFQTYRATAPETVSDKKIRDIMKEHNYKQSKIAEVIQDWWDNPPEVVEEWVLTGKQKKATQPESQNNATERRTPGNAGRGRTREGGAGGRGAGAAGRGDRPADRKRDSRSASPRAGDKSQAVEGTEDPALGNVPAPVAAAPAWGARKSASAGGANKGSDSAPASSSGPSRERKDRERVSKSKSKENSNGINLNVASNLPAVGIWNSTESAAQRLKRLESEKEAAKKPAEPEPAAIVPEEKEGRTKKKKERSRGGRGGQAAAAAAAEDVPSAAETAAAAPVQTSILENLSNIAGVTGASEGAQTSEADNTAESPKVGLKMGKWEAKSDRIGEGESLSFGSFGNTSNLTSSSPGASASAWGSSAPESQSETMDAVSSAWSGAQGAGGDSLGKADEGDKSDMPPGLSSGSASMGVSAGKGGPRSGMSNQGRGKPEDSQFSQSQPSASAQPTNFYQQPPGIGAGVRSNIGLAAGPYGTQNFDQSAQYAQAGFQAQAPGASGISGSASSATGSAASPNLPLQQGQQPQQPPQQPPGYAQQPAGMPAYYYNNPYYPQYPYYSQTPMGVQPQPYFQGRGNFPGGRGGYSDVYSNVYQQQQQQQPQQQPQQGQQQGQQGQQSGGDFTSGQQSGQFDGMQKGQSQLNGQGGPGGNKPSGGSDSATQQQSMPYNGYINPNPYTAAQSNWTGYSQSAGGYGTPMMYPGSSGAAGQSSFPGQQLPGQPHQQGQSGRDSNRNNNPRGWGM